MTLDDLAAYGIHPFEDVDDATALLLALDLLTESATHALALVVLAHVIGEALFGWMVAEPSSVVDLRLVVDADGTRTWSCRALGTSTWVECE